MSISGVSAGSTYYASMPARLHSSGCSCAMCMPQTVKSSPTPTDLSGKPVKTDAGKAESGSAREQQLSREEMERLRALQERDRQVRQHEQAHMAAASGLVVSGPSYTYQRGPDGVNYAVGGEVAISVSKGRTPEETITKAQTIERAALAPQDPSAADRAIAAQARQMAMDAQGEQARQAQEEEPSKADDKAGATSTEAASNTRQGQRARQAYERSPGTQDFNQGLLSAYA